MLPAVPTQKATLKPYLEEIRQWVEQGRTDIWIAHTLNSTPASISAFRSQHGILRRDAAEGRGASVPPPGKRGFPVHSAAPGARRARLEAVNNPPIAIMHAAPPHARFRRAPSAHRQGDGQKRNPRCLERGAAIP